MKALVGLAFFGILAACTTAEQFAERAHTQCHSRGLSAGTQAYDDCRLIQDQIRVLDANRQTRSLMILGLGPQIQAPTYTLTPVPGVPSLTNCRVTQLGSEYSAPSRVTCY